MSQVNEDFFEQPAPPRYKERETLDDIARSVRQMWEEMYE